MAGYTRADTTNQIANGQIADANILDAEFDGVEVAFSATTGHSHSGSGGEGAPITVVGPAQDYVATSTAFNPKSNSTYDLGSSGARFRDLLLSRDVDAAGNVRVGQDLVIGGVTVSASPAEINILDGATVSTLELNRLDGILSTTAELNFLQGVTSNVQAQLNALEDDIQAAVAGALEVTGAASTVVTADLVADRAVVSSGTGKIAASGVTTTELNRLSGIAVSTSELNHLSGVTSNVQTQLNTIVTTAFPAGGIIIWSGTIAAIPSGWALCNGTSGTPDLRGRMIIGAGGTYAVGDTGGASTVTLSEASLPSHTHTFSATTGTESADHVHSGTTSTAGAHAHTLPFGTNGDTGLAQAGGSASAGQLSTGSAGDHSHTFTTGGRSAAHTHNVSGTTSSTGSGSAINILNPYYALAYIMKL